MRRKRHRQDEERGREAERPSEIPAPGWKDVLVRTKREVKNDNISIVAAGVAFYAFLAIFPALAALIAIYGLVADPADVQRQAEPLTGAVPGGVQELMREQMARLAGESGRSLGLGALFGILVALWSANKGTSALVTALNIAYDEEEKRGFFRKTATTLGLTVGGVFFGALAVGLVVVIPALLGRVGLGNIAATLIQWLRWPMLAAAVLFALAVVYRYGPSRDRPQWRWVSWGSVVATALWLLASAGFSFYVSRFGSYNETYGSVAAIAILLFWFFLSAYIVILGAELNAEMEHQTARDTTAGRPQPRGRRGAYAADTVGEVPA